MLVRPDEKVPIARLLTFLESGERLAQDCAKKQAAIAGESGAARFLRGQARQEAMHAYVFQGAIAWLAPRHLGDLPFLPALEGYRAKLDEAFRRQDLYEALVAEQIILEGLGEAILNRIESGLAKREAPFEKLRRILLHQEEAHHTFGVRMLERGVAAGLVDYDTLRGKAVDYLEMTRTMVVTLADLFETIDEDPAAWAGDVRGYLPAWISA